MAINPTRAGLPLINILRLKGVPILQQLHLEERLLRTTSDNWCIINDGTIDPTIVMGISGMEISEDFIFLCSNSARLAIILNPLGPTATIHPPALHRLKIAIHKQYDKKPKELIEIESVLRDEIPVIRRFTGGGTVIVDQGTLFVTFICNKGAVPDLQSYPQPIMSWSSIIYKKVFQGIGDFSLRENDYVLGNRKFGGNAQSITKNRWVHHTSFLWDFETSNMGYLKQPKRAPDYRQARDHLEFICRMKNYISRTNFFDRTIAAVGDHFVLKPLEIESIENPLISNFEPSSRLLARDELQEETSKSPGAKVALSS